jgi:diaminopimelate epimerase
MGLVYLYDANGNLLWLIEATAFDFVKYAQLAQQLCAETGDGLLVFDPETKQVWIINADGSDGEFCGNGLQATAFHVGAQAMTLKMGLRSIQAMVDARGVCIMLDASVNEPKKMSWKGNEAYAIAMPNPHWVFIAPPAEWRLDQEGRACCVEHHVNVEWVRAASDCFVVDVYERGAGITAACGSGALAVFEVLRYLGCVSQQAKIKMPGGILTVKAMGAKLSLQGQVRLLKSRVV